MCWGSGYTKKFDLSGNIRTPPKAGSPWLAAGPLASLETTGAYYCAVTAQGETLCWADTPSVQTLVPGAAFSAVRIQRSDGCGLTESGKARCWGPSLQYGTAPPEDAVFASITFARRAMCGLTTQGQVLCWGSKEDSDRLTENTPRAVFTAIDGSSEDICGLTEGGQVICWGQRSKETIEADGGSFSALSVGHDHSCALNAEGRATCWGKAAEYMEPVPDASFDAISAGLTRTCGVKAGGAALCWGAGGTGSPEAMDGPFAKAFPMGRGVCTLDTEGRFRCSPQDGPLDALEPPGELRDAAFTDIHISGQNVCGIMAKGDLVCWSEQQNTIVVPAR